MQIGARQHGPCHNNDHDCDHSTFGQQPVREEAHGRSSGGTARLCHKISPRASPLAEAGNQSPSVAAATTDNQRRGSTKPRGRIKPSRIRDAEFGLHDATNNAYPPEISDGEYDKLK